MPRERHLDGDAGVVNVYLDRESYHDILSMFPRKPSRPVESDQLFAQISYALEAGETSGETARGYDVVEAGQAFLVEMDYVRDRTYGVGSLYIEGPSDGQGFECRSDVWPETGKGSLMVSRLDGRPEIF